MCWIDSPSLPPLLLCVYIDAISSRGFIVFARGAQWCRSKPTAMGALLIAKGALFLHASLYETLKQNPRIYINK